MLFTKIRSSVIFYFVLKIRTNTEMYTLKLYLKWTHLYFQAITSFLTFIFGIIPIYHYSIHLFLMITSIFIFIPLCFPLLLVNIFVNI